MKKRVHVLSPGNSPNSLSFIFPLRANRTTFYKRGIGIKIYSGLEMDEALRKGLFVDCDALFVDSKYFRDWWKDRQDEVYKFFLTARKRVGRICWFDTSDSTGTPQFQVLPYVDGYYKNQILKDKNDYANKTYYRERIFFDYYYRHFSAEDEGETGCEHRPEPRYLDKIEVSWNPALSNHGLNRLGIGFGNSAKVGNRISTISNKMGLPAWYTRRSVDVDSPRKIGVTARVGSFHKRSIVCFHRKRIIDQLKRFTVIEDHFINYMAYCRELLNARVCVSPFGTGEITYRDFDAILCGALLVKPDMGHLETWPDLYRDGRTYVSFKWDFSDLEEKIKYFLDEPAKARAIADEAQKVYNKYLFGNGREEFCGRVESIVSGKRLESEEHIS